MLASRLFATVIIALASSALANCASGPAPVSVPVPVLQPPAGEGFSTPENTLRSFYVALGMGEAAAIRGCFLDPNKAWYLPPQRMVITAYRVKSTRIYTDKDVAFYQRMGTSLDIKVGDAALVVEEYRLGSDGGYFDSLSYLLREADGRWKIMHAVGGMP